jgi:hypothetical protein
MNKLTTKSADRLLVDFFDEQQTSAVYAVQKARTGPIDKEVARMLNAEIRGDTLSIGGVWDFFQWPTQVAKLTVMDLSRQMLDAYAPQGAERVLGDFYEHDFGPERFDSVVLPLILHHVAQGSWRSCEARIEAAIDRAHRWLKRGGRLFIMEYCPHPVWQPLQRGLLPVTRRSLRLVGQPLVVMHALSFYERVLRTQFSEHESRPIRPEGFDWSKWFPLFMATPWLQLPLTVYPKPYLLVAKR